MQAEIAMRAAGKPGMSDEEVGNFYKYGMWYTSDINLYSEVDKFADFQVMDFVSRYLPAYNAYLPALYAEGPSGSDPKRVLVIEIDEGRNPIP